MTTDFERRRAGWARRAARCGLSALACALAVIIGPAAGPASAATSFFALNDSGAKLEMAGAQARVIFVKEFIQPPPICGTCGEPGTPEDQQWAKGKTNEPGFVSLVHRATNQCVDVPGAAVRSAGADVARLEGTALVLAPCDNSETQKWKSLFQTGNSATYQNKWSGLVLTRDAATARLHPFNKRLRGPDFFGVQNFNSQRTGAA